MTRLERTLIHSSASSLRGSYSSPSDALIHIADGDRQLADRPGIEFAHVPAAVVDLLLVVHVPHRIVALLDGRWVVFRVPVNGRAGYCFSLAAWVCGCRSEGSRAG